MAGMDPKTDQKAKDFPRTQNIFEGSGFTASGLVSEVSSYTNKDKVTRWSVVVFAPGNHPLKIGLREQPDPTRFPVGSKVQMRFKVSDFKGSLMFSEEF